MEQTENLGGARAPGAPLVPTPMSHHFIVRCQQLNNVHVQCIV